MKRAFLLLMFLFVLSVNIHAQSQDNKAEYIKNEAPKYADSAFILMQPLYEIDTNRFDEYHINKIKDIGVDADGNLYVLDYFDAKILVFDNTGTHLRTMGGNGQGPGELQKPVTFAIQNGRLYVVENFRGVKVWDLYGKYIDYLLFKISNYELIRAKGDFLITDEIFVDFKKDRYLQTFRINKYNTEMKFSHTIATTKTQMRETPTFFPWDYIAIDSENCVYFPDNAREYKINKYAINGDLLFSFGREYKSEKYSDDILKKWGMSMSEIREKSRLELSNYPPVVRYILVDDYDNVWVVVGEWSGDDMGIAMRSSTIDIFTNKGEFLYSFRVVFSSCRRIRDELSYSDMVLL